MDKNQIENIEMDLLLEAMFKRYGYDFRQYSKSSIRRRIKQFLIKSGCSNVIQLIQKILYDEYLFESLVYNFSVTVTEMFRDPDFFLTIREKLVPYLKTYPSFKIWHAGCATGEEVYSMAIILKEAGLYDKGNIIATDYNDASLEKAKDGVFPIEQIKLYTENYQKSGGSNSFSEYYHSKYNYSILENSLKNNIFFTNHNMAMDSVFGIMNVVICRNVLIYFDKELQNRVLNLFDESLVPNGFLCLGTKESLRFSDIVDRYKPVDDEQKIYQKKG